MLAAKGCTTGCIYDACQFPQGDAEKVAFQIIEALASLISTFTLRPVKGKKNQWLTQVGKEESLLNESIVHFKSQNVDLFSNSTVWFWVCFHLIPRSLKLGAMFPTTFVLFNLFFFPSILSAFNTSKLLDQSKNPTNLYQPGTNVLWSNFILHLLPLWYFRERRDWNTHTHTETFRNKLILQVASSLHAVRKVSFSHF